MKYAKVWVLCWLCKGTKKAPKHFPSGPCTYCDGKGGRLGKAQLYRVIGGPCDAMRLTEEQASADYVRYNASAAGRWTGSRRKSMYPCVLIHKELLR